MNGKSGYFVMNNTELAVTKKQYQHPIQYHIELIEFLEMFLELRYAIKKHTKHYRRYAPQIDNKCFHQ